MLLSYERIRIKDAVATEAVKQAFAVLRFYDATQINDLALYCRKLIARLLADISEETYQASIFLDLLAKEHAELLVPKLKDAYEDIKGARCKVEPDSVQAMSETMERLVRERTGIIDEQVDLTESKSYLVAPYTSEPTFRDIDNAITLLKELDDANNPIEAQSTRSGEEVAAIAAILQAKHKNLALDRVQKMRKLLLAHTAAEKALNAFHVAKILRKQCCLHSNADVEAFLEKDAPSLMDLAWSALEQYYQS